MIYFEDGFFWENDGFYIIKFIQSSQNLFHRFRIGFFGHSTNTDNHLLLSLYELLLLHRFIKGIHLISKVLWTLRTFHTLKE